MIGSEGVKKPAISTGVKKPQNITEHIKAQKAETQNLSVNINSPRFNRMTQLPKLSLTVDEKDPKGKLQGEKIKTFTNELSKSQNVEEKKTGKKIFSFFDDPKNGKLILERHDRGMVDFQLNDIKKGKSASQIFNEQDEALLGKRGAPQPKEIKIATNATGGKGVVQAGEGKDVFVEGKVSDKGGAQTAEEVHKPQDFSKVSVEGLGIMLSKIGMKDPSNGKAMEGSDLTQFLMELKEPKAAA